MHPVETRAYVHGVVRDLRQRLSDRPDLRVVDIDLDIGGPGVYVAFDHEDYITAGVVERSPLLLSGGQRIRRNVRVPLLGEGHRVRRLVLHLGLDGYDLLAPTANLLTDQREPLHSGEWPKSFDGRGIVQDHPRYGRPFFCRRGIREYHEHPQHEDDPWVRYRNGLPLHAIVVELLSDLRTRWHGAA